MTAVFQDEKAPTQLVTEANSAPQKFPLQEN